MKIRITGLIKDLREISPTAKIYPIRFKDKGSLYLEINKSQDKTALINLLSDICDRQ